MIRFCNRTEQSTPHCSCLPCFCLQRIANSKVTRSGQMVVCVLCGWLFLGGVVFGKQLCWAFLENLLAHSLPVPAPITMWKVQ